MLRDLSEFLYATREELKRRFGNEWTQEAVAMRVAKIVPGFTRKRLVGLEQGIKNLPERNVLEALAQVYNAPYVRLLDIAGYLPSKEEADQASHYEAIRQASWEEILRLKGNISDENDVFALKRIITETARKYEGTAENK